MLCASYGHRNTRRRTEGSSSLMRRKRSIRRTEKQCFGLYLMSDPAARILPSTATVTGLLWWNTTQRTGQANYCIARRA